MPYTIGHVIHPSQRKRLRTYISPSSIRNPLILGTAYIMYEDWQTTYEGELLDGEPYGVGKFRYEVDHVHKGTFKNGRQHGLIWHYNEFLNTKYLLVYDNGTGK